MGSSIPQRWQQFPFSVDGDMHGSTTAVAATLSDIIVPGGTDARDSITAADHHKLLPSHPRHEQQWRHQALHTPSSVYVHQLEHLHRLLRPRQQRASSGSVSHFHHNWGQRKEAKHYRGVRQRHHDKWVAQIRLSQNRMRVWLGTYDSAEAAAHAYDRAAHNLRGDHARLNFPELRDASGAVLGRRLSALRSSVDAKIRAVCQRLNRERKGKKKAAADRTTPCGGEVVRSYSNSSSGMPTEKWREETDGEQMAATCSSSISTNWNSPSEEESELNTGGCMLEEAEGLCSLESMPSFDPELIWHVLAS